MLGADRPLRAGRGQTRAERFEPVPGQRDPRTQRPHLPDPTRSHTGGQVPQPGQQRRGRRGQVTGGQRPRIQLASSSSIAARKRGNPHHHTLNQPRRHTSDTSQQVRQHRPPNDPDSPNYTRRNPIVTSSSAAVESYPPDSRSAQTARLVHQPPTRLPIRSTTTDASGTPALRADARQRPTHALGHIQHVGHPRSRPRAHPRLRSPMAERSGQSPPVPRTPWASDFVAHTRESILQIHPSSALRTTTTAWWSNMAATFTPRRGTAFR
jgi:hypothetical protein